MLENDDVVKITALQNNSPDSDVNQVISLYKEKYFDNPEAAALLATVLAKTGEVLSPTADHIADVASTGGPSSLSTLLAPLYLRAAGMIVPKLGVPGRPAGGIDCLAQIRGYRTDLDIQKVNTVLESCGYVHFVAKGMFAPLDGRMFMLRQANGAQNVPGLVVASLLAKKLAVGVKRAGLDIRVAKHGNFGESWEKASSNAYLFKEAADILGIRAFPVLTDARFLYQPYVGRSESLVALNDFFENKGNTWLDIHCSTCKTLALACIPDHYRGYAANCTRDELFNHFVDNVKAQDSNEDAFYELVNDTVNSHNYELVSEQSGFCSYDLKKIRDVLVEFQKEYSSDGTEFPDPVGIKFICAPGQFVGRGETLGTFRAPKEHYESALAMLKPIICYPGPNPCGYNLEGINE